MRLPSVDLCATADITALGDVFDFAKDHLGLLKAAVIAAGLVPPGVEGSGSKGWQPVKTIQNGALVEGD